METILVVVTLISIGTAVGAFVSTRRVQRREQERSEARVAVLAAAAADAHPEAARLTTPALHPTTPALHEARWVSEASARETSAAVSEDAHAGLFGTVQRAEPAGNRLPMLAAAALLVLLGGAVLFFNSSSSEDQVATSAPVARPEPLELVSLGHSRDTSLLTIAGTVRNPASGAKLEGLTAVVSLLDRNGTLVSTKDVPLDYRALGPGEEAPFKVSIPDSATVARYRVSFRAGADVVPHVDRRTDAKLASAR